MSEYLDRIAAEWRERAGELAQWTMTHLVNRTDVWGHYLSKQQRQSELGARNAAVTAPFVEQRGKVFLTIASLEKHFRAAHGGGILGLHSASAELTSRWLAIDIDLHDEDDLSVSASGNLSAALAWREKLAEAGCDPLLFDSNGAGGFHLLLMFAEPMETQGVFALGQRLVEDHEHRGIDAQPDVFPKKPHWNHFGNWLRLFGRHHTRDHFTRVWNDEPWAEEKWLDGHDAIDRILRTRPVELEVAASLKLARARQTVCLDFDGVLHSYQSGWCGAEIIPDPPLHGTREAVALLRKRYRVVIHSARCATDAGCEAVSAWLQKHNIKVDEVCRFKPPAAIYVDDRAVPFRGDWQQAVADINAFRK
jgi:putative DNA primase/helicase